MSTATTSLHVDFTAAQLAAIAAVVTWFSDPCAPQTFRLFGYAGTGKTTLAQAIVARLGLPTHAVRYAAFSGKAADVLRRKGCAGARTIHSLIYHPVDNDAVIARLRRQIELETSPPAQRVLQARLVEAMQPDFELSDGDDLDGVRLVVLDEASMVSDEIIADLLAHGVRVLALGDPAQLPPVKGAGGLINGKPDVQLTELHRSALDSPVTRIATAVRQAEVGDRLLGVAGPDGDSGRRRDVDAGHLLHFDQVLCWRNATRWALIEQMRGGRGPLPEPGERVMTLANSAEAEVLNGQQWTVVSAELVRGKVELVVDSEDGVRRSMTAWPDGFVDHKGEKEATYRGRGGTVAATWACAITVHKSQGSQWDHVLVVDETSIIRWVKRKELGADNPMADGEAHLAARQWLYTAVTRAAKVVIIVDPRQVA